MMGETKHVVYALDEDDKPGHFLAAVDIDELDDIMDKWWKAFRNGEKQKPKEYNGISHRPVSDFERWKAPEDTHEETNV